MPAAFRLLLALPVVEATAIALVEDDVGSGGGFAATGRAAGGGASLSERRQRIRSPRSEIFKRINSL